LRSDLGEQLVAGRLQGQREVVRAAADQVVAGRAGQLEQAGVDRDRDIRGDLDEHHPRRAGVERGLERLFGMLAASDVNQRGQRTVALGDLDRPGAREHDHGRAGAGLELELDIVAIGELAVLRDPGRRVRIGDQAELDEVRPSTSSRVARTARASAG